MKSRYGDLRVLSKPDLISVSIRRYGEWAQSEIDIMRQFIEPGDTVLDVGAFIGTHSRAFSSFVGETGRVYSFEPQPDIFAILQDNAALAPNRNIIPKQMALGAAEGVGELVIHDATNLGATAIMACASLGTPAPDSKNSVAIGTIDSLGIDAIRFIKVDAEGYEIEILMGAAKTIRRDQPAVAMEVNSIDKAYRIFDYAKNIGYRCFGYAPLSYNPNNFNGEGEDVYFPGAVECGILLIAGTSADQMEIPSNVLHLPELTSVDDISLLLLQKPQYPFEVLAKSRLASVLPVPAIDIGGRKLAAFKEREGQLENERRNLSASVETLQEALKSRDGKLAAFKEREGQLENEQRNLSASVETLQEALKSRDGKLANLDAELKQSEVSLSVITNSLSWRITAPMRHVATEFKRAFARFRKGEKGVAMRKEVNMLSGSQDPKNHIYIERAICVGLELQIEGWFFNESARTASAELTIESPRFPQKFLVRTGRERGDVASSFNHVNGLRSGFRITCLLDAAAGLPETAEIAFALQNDVQPAVYRFGLHHTPYRQMRVARHIVRRLNGRRLKTGLGDIAHGRLDSLWMRLNHVFQHRHKEKSPRPSVTNLRDALELLSPEPLPVPVLDRPVDIIIPAYNCLQYLDPLFESLEKNTPTMHPVIVVDNGNTGQEMRERLKAFAESRPGVTLIRLEENQGFVGAVNRAAEIAKHDFVLLNTDVIVPPNWLERLFAPIVADRKVASVTPFSNAATVCSFPEFCTDNAIYGDLTVDQIDRWFERVRVEKIGTDLPSGVGFCMAMSRDVWLEIGAFDEVAFRRGYGEENDWCLRAQAKGYRNLIAPNLFAYHKHGGTFESSTRAELRQNSLNEVARRFPSYLSDVAAYCERDPLRPLREILAIVVACREAGQPSYLIVDHQLGGGANHYRQRQVQKLVAAGSPVLTLLINAGVSPDLGDSLFKLEFRFGHLTEILNVAGMEDVKALAKLAGIKTIFVNQLVSFEAPLDLADFLIDLKAATGAKTIVPIHDFYPICPSYVLLSKDGSYCGLPETSVCGTCLPANRFASNPDNCGIERWRTQWGALMKEADEILCFSEDSRTKVAKVYPDAASRILVRPHAIETAFDRKPLLSREAALHVGVAGAIGPQKGALVVNELAQKMREFDPNARITVIGKLDKPSDAPNLNVTGHYEPRELPDLLERERINICLFPSIWPETFSYVTEELITLGVPLAVFDLGAPPERVRGYARGRVLDVSLARDPAKLYEALVAFKKEIEQTAS